MIRAVAFKTEPLTVRILAIISIAFSGLFVFDMGCEQPEQARTCVILMNHYRISLKKS
jgi:hypothetical protein